MEKGVNKKTMLDKLYEAYNTTVEGSGSKMAQKSLNKFKESLLNK